jgi:tRNA dimethylallyltransferase
LAGDKLRIICGPTAAGKSDLALKLCEIYNAAIVSADSRQIYCEFNIGTAKPTREECARVTHYGIDVVEPAERYSAARWAREAREWIESAGEIEKESVAVVGGTGLYIKALVDPLFNAPEQDPSKREQLEGELATMSIDDLRRWCRQLDPVREHLGRTQLLRAIETALLSGSRISDLHSRHNAEKGIEADGERPLYLLVDPGTALASRIEARVDKMLGAEWADEVRELMRTVAPDAPAWKASGYMVMRSHVEGALDLSSATQRVIIETRQYAKRQRTWFRNQLPANAVTQVNPDDPHALTIAREWWEKAE